MSVNAKPEIFGETYLHQLHLYRVWERVAALQHQHVPLVYGVWCMVYGVWCMVYGVYTYTWCMVYGVYMYTWCIRTWRTAALGTGTTTVLSRSLRFDLGTAVFPLF